MKTDCNFVQEHLSAWLDNELDMATTSHIQQHLAVCNSCAEDVNCFEKIGRLVRASSANPDFMPPWEIIEKKINVFNDSREWNKQAWPEIYGQRVLGRKRRWGAWAGVVAALAAFWILIIGLGKPYFAPNPLEDLRSEANITHVPLNLEPVLATFQNDPLGSIKALNAQYELNKISLADADNSFGRSTFVSQASRSHALPGTAHPDSTLLLSLPSCPCPKGKCTCGEYGCNCIVSICQRPDGSVYLIFEQCTSQNVNFGSLAVKNVQRLGVDFQEVRHGNTRSVSFDWSFGKVVVVGLRNDSEVDSLFLSN